MTPGGTVFSWWGCVREDHRHQRETLERNAIFWIHLKDDGLVTTRQTYKDTSLFFCRSIRNGEISFWEGELQIKGNYPFFVKILLCDTVDKNSIRNLNVQK